ncbi:MAG TPA: hypothetical protein VJP76_06165 [Candidatus Tumulicola sp.]|nr:hypothetical protein [Candidatus Tumulicola sp.]
MPPTYAGPGLGTNLNDQLQPAAVDTTSILKQLTKTVAIGSTIDPTNGDKTPYGLLYVKKKPYGSSPLAKGDLVICNYADSSGTLGNGTTVDALPSKPGSKSKTYVQNAKLKGCAGVTISGYDAVYAADSTAKNVSGISSKGKIVQTLTNKALPMPWSVTYNTGFGYPPGDAIYTSDMSTGNVITLDLGAGSGPSYVTGITGFAVSGSSPGSMRGPTGVQYNPRNDTLYILDGVTNSLVSVAHAYEVLQQNGAIKVSADGKTFTGPGAKDAKLLHIGKPLNDPIGSTLLPNGNLVVSNGAGSNMLVEIASNGQVLATKVVDKGKAHAVPGLASNGTSDTNTVIYFNDDNKNNVQLLTR